MRIRIIPRKNRNSGKRLRVCAYARVSTATEEQEDSLVNQTAYYQQLISDNPAWEFAGVYSDEGITGYKENRPGFQQMLQDARRGKFDMVLVKSISRFARNTYTLLDATRELKALGISVFFELQNIDTLSASGETTPGSSRSAPISRFLSPPERADSPRSARRSSSSSAPEPSSSSSR